MVQVCWKGRSYWNADSTWLCWGRSTDCSMQGSPLWYWGGPGGKKKLMHLKCFSVLSPLNWGESRGVLPCVGQPGHLGPTAEPFRWHLCIRFSIFLHVSLSYDPVTCLNESKHTPASCQPWSWRVEVIGTFAAWVESKRKWGLYMHLEFIRSYHIISHACLQKGVV